MSVHRRRTLFEPGRELEWAEINRDEDRADLEALERVNGELPIEPIPGLDD